jgi:hypothetical protein
MKLGVLSARKTSIYLFYLNKYSIFVTFET